MIKEKYIGVLENLFGEEVYLYTYADSIEKAKKNLEYQKSQKGELKMFRFKKVEKELKEDISEKEENVMPVAENIEYEEEHKTTFETWQKDIKENERLRTQVNAKENIIKEVREYMNNLKWFEMVSKDVDMTLYASTKDFWHDISSILDKVGETDDSKRNVQ